MKRILSFVLCIAVMCSVCGVSADSSSAANMEKVLVSVKSKVDVPDSFNEFDSNVNVSGDKTNYMFFWSDKDRSRTLEVVCDDFGRISNYYYYGNNYSKKRISSVTKQQILDFCDDFLHKTLPEAYSDDGTDVLEADLSTYSANGNLRYNLSYTRLKNGIEVMGNSVSISVYESEDKLYVSNMSAYIDYETEFAEEEYGDFDPVNVYKEKYPAELIYRNDYTLYKGEGTDKRTKLVYRIKDNQVGYIRATDGTVAEPDAEENYRFAVENSMMADTAAGGASMEKNMLTEAELTELAQVEKLMSVDEIKNILKKLPYVDFDTKLETAGVSLNKNDDNEYMYRVNFNNSKDTTAVQYKYVNAVVNAHNGKVIYINSNMGYDASERKELTETQKNLAEKKIDEFLRYAAGDALDDVQIEATECSYDNVHRRYVRMVNGVRYIDNGIAVSFDGAKGRLRNYSLNMTKAKFDNPDDAISANMAYKVILDYAPIMAMYIKCDGEFVKCFTLSKSYAEVDAIKGEIINPEGERSEYKYTDLDGHWAQEAVEKLSEMQIGISGDVFEPDKAMTQQELLRLFAGAMMNKYYLDLSEDDLYRTMIDDHIITEGEKSPQSTVAREDAFVYMIRMAGLDKVAKLEDIYKVSYADGNQITQGKTGYAAILSGMKIINGSGGTIRPLEHITRAEAATMIYKYLLTY